MSDQQPPPHPPAPGGDQPPAPGYWKASDGNWYPPQQPQPHAQQPPPPPQGPGGDQPPAPGYWKASDGNWYPPQQPQSQPQPYGQQPPPARGGGMPGWGKGCLISVAVLVVFGVLAFACVAVVGNEAADQLDRAVDEAGEDTTVPKFDGPEPTCTYVGTEDISGMQVELTFTNPLGEVNEIEAPYALLDGDGTRFFTKSVWLQDATKFPGPNQQYRILDDTFEDLPPNVDESTIGCTVLDIQENTTLSGFQRASDTDTCTVLGTDPSGSIQVEVTVTSPYQETTKVQTWWALDAPGGVRFAGATEVNDLVAAGETFRISPSFGVEKPGWVGDGEVTCVVLGFWDQGG